MLRQCFIKQFPYAVVLLNPITVNAGDTVQWVNAVRQDHDNPNPGMGISFVDLTLADRERIVAAIRTIAYLRESPCPQKKN